MVRNLNTALVMAEAGGEEVDEFSEVLSAARDAGYIISNLNPTADNCYFVWESSTNQFLLVDGEKNYEVIFASEEGYPAIGETWYFATSDRDVAEELKATVESLGAQVMDMYADAKDVSEALAAGGEQTLYVDESVVLDSANILKVDKAGADITIEMGDATLNTNGTITGIPVSVATGKLTINGGNIGGSGTYTNENGPSSTAVGFDAGELVLNGTTVIGDKNGISGCNNTDGSAKIELNDATVKAGSYAVTVSCGGKGAVSTLNNTNTEAAVPFFVSQGGKIVINGGTHVSTGNMSSHDFSDAIFYIQKDQQYGVSSVVITDGTFVCNGATKTYKELCAAGVDAWKNLCIFQNCTGVVTIADGKVTISTN